MSAQRTRRRHLSKRRKFARVVLVLLAMFSTLGFGGVAAALVGYNTYLGQLPDAATLAAMEPPLDSPVYAADGTLIAVFHDPNFRHQHVNLVDISRWVKLATVDVEDRHFYEEASWDLPRIAKSAWDDATHAGATQGASTITQQLAKISFLSPEQSVDRKIKQVILGNEIDANFTKDKILEMYLNRIWYGNHSVGIETAAEMFFQVRARDLDLAQASMLVGLPQSPTTYNPFDHDAANTINPLAKQRQSSVLQAMVSNNDITQAQADTAFKEPLAFHLWTESEPHIAPSFVDYLRNYLNTTFGDTYITPGGWQIYTSVDLKQQAVADISVTNGVNAIASKNARDAALVSINPATGAVKAMTGTWNYTDASIGQLNMAIRTVRPGSTIKVFTYTAAIASRKYTMSTPVLDAPITLSDGSTSGYTPLNYDRRFHGTCTVAKCLGNSFNVPAVKVEADVGIPYITNLEIAAGLSSLNDPANKPAPNQYAATLGGLTYGITPLDLADGAATIADMGVHHDPAPVDHIIEAGTGKVIYKYDPVATGIQVVPPDVAFIMNEMLSNDNNRLIEFGPGGDLTLPGRRVAAKTGTTDFFEDNWTVGWTQQAVTAVWVGNPTPSCLKPADRDTMLADMNNRVLYRGQGIDDPFSPSDLAAYGLQPVNNNCGHLEGSSGITGAAPIWHDYMATVLSAFPATWYTKPADVVGTAGNDNSTFYLPGSTGSRTINNCWYYASKPNPASTCDYLGTAPTRDNPAPGAFSTPNPG